VPTKAAYLYFETNPDAEFECRLALRLGMTVERLRREMSAAEFGRWVIYFARKAQREELRRKAGQGGGGDG
jgi:hypothetical protein